MTDAREKMPEWPVRPDETIERFKEWFSLMDRDFILDYERARAEAAIQRLRVAVEALGFIHINAESDSTDGRATSEHAREALSTIGEIPE